MQGLGQGLEDDLELQYDDDDADTLKVVQCFVWSNSFSNLQSKLFTDNVIKKRLLRHHFDYGNF